MEEKEKDKPGITRAAAERIRLKFLSMMFGMLRDMTPPTLDFICVFKPSENWIDEMMISSIEEESDRIALLKKCIRRLEESSPDGEIGKALPKQH